VLPDPREARSLADLGQSLLLRSQQRQAEIVLKDALSESRAVGARPVEAHALCSLGTTLAELGRTGEGFPMLRDALPPRHTALLAARPPSLGLLSATECNVTKRRCRSMVPDSTTWPVRYQLDAHRQLAGGGRAGTRSGHSQSF